MTAEIAFCLGALLTLPRVQPDNKTWWVSKFLIAWISAIWAGTVKSDPVGGREILPYGLGWVTSED